MNIDPRARTTMLIATLLVLSAPLAGCVGTDGSDELTNDAPTAALTASDREAWTGAELSFDAGGSEDPDGEIATYLFDFGDGNTTRVSNGDDPVVTHAYERPGLYAVQVTVTDDGANGTTAASDTASVTVAVHEEVAVEGQAVAVDAPINETAPKTYRQAVDASGNAERFELNLTLTDVVPVGSSEVTVRVLDPSGAELVSDNVTTSDNATVELAGAFASAGPHTIEITADSGAISFEGVFKTYTRAPDEA